MRRLWVRAERATFIGMVRDDTKGMNKKNTGGDQKIKIEQKSTALASASVPVQTTSAIDSPKLEEQKEVRLALISAIGNTPAVKLSIIPLLENAPRTINYLWFAPRLPFREACDVLGRCKSRPFLCLVNSPVVHFPRDACSDDKGDMRGCAQKITPFELS